MLPQLKHFFPFAGQLIPQILSLLSLLRDRHCSVIWRRLYRTHSVRAFFLNFLHTRHATVVAIFVLGGASILAMHLVIMDPTVRAFLQCRSIQLVPLGSATAVSWLGVKSGKNSLRRAGASTTPLSFSTAYCSGTSPWHCTQ